MKDSDAEIVSVSNSQKSQASTTFSDVAVTDSSFSNNTELFTDFSIDFADLNKIGDETLFTQAEVDDIMKDCTEGSSGADIISLDQSLEDFANTFCFSPIASSPAPVVSTGNTKKRSLGSDEEATLEEPKTKKARAQAQAKSSATLAPPESNPSYQKKSTQSKASTFTLALPELNSSYQKNKPQSNSGSP
ncbi:unnamed protein product [Ambrosiozyma monospora]|uniref:Unnamed protein product n=1 Tax=Ambrosiozyma monospora TaxID=43982 RepID=A0ACB5TNM4_AMBMO|nr:unnamed protein product [Ambrosiozyma monospora]